MAKFNVMDAETGEVKYSGRPRYNGVYCKVSYLEFSEIASPTPIDWKVGDYVVYTRTGLTYRLFDIPQPKKQARRNEYGGAFIYSNVQFHADTKRLEIEPFRDVVIEDNDIHFSTRESWSVWTNVADLMQRFQAVMDEARPGEWEFRLLDIESGGSFNGAFSFAFQQGEAAAAELHDLLYNNYQNFTISGDSVLSGLDKIYSQWNNIGWMHIIEDGKNVIIVGIPSMRILGVGTDAPGRYLYGKGNGLLSLKKTFANKDDLRTRLFVYGSTRNMIPRYYNNLVPHIKDHESVDIQHLMIPLSEWGSTDGKKDASKAYIEANTEEFGVRPDTVYFDGRDLEEIYPSIEGVTIGNLYDAMVSGAQYRPSLSKWDRNDRIDEVVSSAGISDDGMVSQGGDKYNQSQTITTRQIETSEWEDFSQDLVQSLVLGYSGKLHIDFRGLQAFIADADGMVQTFSSRIEVLIGSRSLFYDVPWSKSGTTYTLDIPDVDARCSAGETLIVRLYVSFTERRASNPVIISVANTTAYLQYASNYGSTFTVTIPQIGFDIATRAALGTQGIATLAMKDGMCGGRSFVVKSCKYNSSLDAWVLTVYRGKDDSIDMLFPNTIYTIAAGDHFVLLDIAMPDTYVTMNEQRLLSRGRELLADVSRIKSFYEPEIDAEFMVNSGRDLREGWYIALRDIDIIGTGMTEYVLVDTLTINEGESNIPTYKITLRERKKISYSRTGITEGGGLTSLAGSTTSEGTTDSSANKQNKLTEEQIAALSYFTVVEVNGHPCLKLNTTYDGLFADGFMSAGGASGTGGGGGGGATALKQLNDVNNNGSNVTRADGTAVQTGDLLAYNTSLSKWVAYPLPAYATMAWVAAQGFLTEHQSLDGYALQSWVNTLLASYVQTTRKITGTGAITGGGTLASDRTLDLNADTKQKIANGDTAHSWGNHANAGYALASAVVASIGGAKGAITLLAGQTGNGTINLSVVQNQLRAAIVGLGSLAFRSGIAFGDLTSHPNDLAGYGIVNAYTKAEADGRFLGIAAEAADSDKLDGYHADHFQEALSASHLAALDFFSVVMVNGLPCLKLNTEYAGLFADGFLSAGGASMGTGGSGSASALKQLNDVQNNGTVITRANGTAVQAGDVLAFNSDANKWVAYPLTAFATQAWVNAQGFLTRQSMEDYLTIEDAAATYQPLISSARKLAASLISGLAAVATSGSYNDLSNKPTSWALDVITGAANIKKIEALAGYGLLRRNADNSWNLDTTQYLPATGKAADADKLDGRDLTWFQQALSTTNKLAADFISGLAAVATSGNYTDLIGKPTTWDLSNITNADDLKRIEALTGAGILKRNSNGTWSLDSTTYQALITFDNKLAASLVSGLSAVATSGNYNDLNNTPSALKSPYALKVGTKTYDGSAAREITKTDLGLGSVENKSASDIISEISTTDILNLLAGSRRQALESGITAAITTALRSMFSIVEYKTGHYALKVNPTMVGEDGVTRTIDGIFTDGFISANGASEGQ